MNNSVVLDTCEDTVVLSNNILTSNQEGRKNQKLNLSSEYYLVRPDVNFKLAWPEAATIS